MKVECKIKAFRELRSWSERRTGECMPTADRSSAIMKILTNGLLKFLTRFSGNARSQLLFLISLAIISLVWRQSQQFWTWDASFPFKFKSKNVFSQLGGQLVCRHYAIVRLSFSHSKQHNCPWNCRIVCLASGTLKTRSQFTTSTPFQREDIKINPQRTVASAFVVLIL